MKKGLFIFILFALSISLTACGGNKESVLKVGATEVPHAEILNKVAKPELEKQGIKLEVVVFQDYRIPNKQTFAKDLDANFFQHLPFLEKTNTEEGHDLVPIVGVHIEPIGAYSNKEKNYTSANDIQNGGTIAISNSASDLGRTLALLEVNGVIKLTEGIGVNGTLNDIIENPKELKFIQVDAALLPRTLEDPKVDVAVINTNFALQAKLNPVEDSLFIEGTESPYINVLAARPDNKDDEKIQKLAEILTSEKTKEFIETEYKGSVVPAAKKF